MTLRSFATCFPIAFGLGLMSVLKPSGSPRFVLPDLVFPTLVLSDIKTKEVEAPLPLHLFKCMGNAGLTGFQFEPERF